MDIKVNYKTLFEYDINNLKQLLDSNSTSIWDKNHLKGRRQETQAVVYVWTEHMDDLFTNIKTLIPNNEDPITKEVWEIAKRIALCYNEPTITRLQLAKLKVGDSIALHGDIKHLCLIHRVHLPIKTNKDCIFQLDGTDYNFIEGQVVEINNQKLHKVYNNGNEDRIHLICDILEKETIDNIDNYVVYDKPWWTKND
jgi:hypothetical protein